MMPAPGGHVAASHLFFSIPASDESDAQKYEHPGIPTKPMGDDALLD